MYSSIIINDDLFAANVLKDKISQTLPGKLIVFKILDNVEEAINYITSNNINLIFIEISSKNKIGFELLNHFRFKFDFLIVFLSSNKDLVFKTIKYRPINFILNPVSRSDILHSYNLLSHFYNKEIFTKNLDNFIFPFKKGFKVERLENVIYCKASGNTTKIIRHNNKDILILKTLKWVSLNIEKTYFFRIHKSFFLNMTYVSYFNKSNNTVELINGEILPVSVRKSKSFYQNLLQIS